MCISGQTASALAEAWMKSMRPPTESNTAAVIARIVFVDRGSCVLSR